MKRVMLIVMFFLFVFSVKAQSDINISFTNDYQNVSHLSLIIYTPDGKIQTRVSNLNPEQIKTYTFPINTEIFVADLKQETFAMKGNDIKSTGVKPFIVLKGSDANRIIKLSSMTPNINLPNNRMYRTAIIKIDPNKLEQYKTALLEQMNTAIKLEPGVLSYTVVADKKDLSSITIMEVYMNLEAYQAHILTPHFKKYKETVKDMVSSLTLIDTEFIASVQKDDF